MQTQTRGSIVADSLEKTISRENSSQGQPAVVQEDGSLSPNLPGLLPVPSTDAPQLLTPEFTPPRTRTWSARASAPSSPETTAPWSKRQDVKTSPLRYFSRKIAFVGRSPGRPSQLLPPLPLFSSPPVAQGESKISSKTPASPQPAFGKEPDFKLNRPRAESTHNLASAQGAHSRSSSMSSQTDKEDAKRVLRTIRDVRDEKYRVKKGDKDRYLVQRKLRYPGYKLLRNAELVQEVDGPDSNLLNYIDHRLRFDYIRNPSGKDKQFTIRMPSAFHEGMAGGFSDIIRDWLGEIRNGKHLDDTVKTREWTMTVASEIGSTLATSIPIEELGNESAPDLSYKHEDCLIPGLLVEVAWSQRGLKLEEKAKRYLEGTGGQVRTVIGFNMNDIYNGGCKAKFFVWGAKKELGDRHKEKWKVYTAVDTEFINDKGQLVEGCELHLSLKDFICEDAEGQWETFEDVPLKVPAQKLYETYKSALSTHAMKAAADGLRKIGKGLNQIAQILAQEDTTKHRKAIDPRKYRSKPRYDWVEVEKLISEGYLENGIYEMKRIMDDVQKELLHVRERMKKTMRVEGQIDGLKSRLIAIEQEIVETSAAVEAEKAGEAGRAGDAEEPEEVIPQEETAEPRTPQPRHQAPETPSRRLRNVFRSAFQRSPRQ